jgi:2-C-methyl-D-erythritol 4-phosphate cytidylyltransferase
MEKTVLIVAGGKGTRMNSPVPKQFLLLEGKPVLMHVIKRFRQYESSIRIVITLPHSQIEAWDILCSEHSFTNDVEVISGGETRTLSVLNGLKVLSTNGIVAIHDGVRPLVSTELIRKCFDAAEKFGCAIPILPVTDSIREIKMDESFAVDRDNFRIVQTPQCFVTGLLRKAYESSPEKNFTDDAGIFERCGNRIHLIDGEKKNIKITTAEDLAIAELFLKMERGELIS